MEKTKTITQEAKIKAVNKIMDKIQNDDAPMNSMSRRICIGITKTGKISVSNINAFICGVPSNSPIVSGFSVDISDINSKDTALEIINQAIQGEMELSI